MAFDIGSRTWWRTTPPGARPPHRLKRLAARSCTCRRRCRFFVCFFPCCCLRMFGFEVQVQMHFVFLFIVGWEGRQGPRAATAKPQRRKGRQGPLGGNGETPATVTGLGLGVGPRCRAPRCVCPDSVRNPLAPQEPRLLREHLHLSAPHLCTQVCTVTRMRARCPHPTRTSFTWLRGRPGSGGLRGWHRTQPA